MLAVAFHINPVLIGALFETTYFAGLRKAGSGDRYPAFAARGSGIGSSGQTGRRTRVKSCGV
jgi:hypothetical protein